MKTKNLLSTLLAACSASMLFAQTGGPDAYGYTWKNQAAVGGPVYTWKNIKGVGTQITGLADDNTVGPFNLNFTFKYYWNDYNKIRIGSNGYIAFQTGVNIASPFPTIPTSGGTNNNYAAGFMCDLTLVTSGTPAQPVPGASVWMWTNNLDSVIVQWDSIPFWSPNAPTYTGRNAFQIILSKVDSSITYQYKYQTGTTQSNDITTGIENSTGVIGLQVLLDVYPTANTAVKFYYPNPVTFQVIDVTPAWNQNMDNGGFFVSGPFGNPVTLSSNIANAGNQNVNTFNVTAQVLNASFTQVYSSNLTAPALVAGQDTTMSFPAQFQSNTPGTYLYRTTSVLPTDMNSGNNITDCELVLVDTTLATVTLAYDNGSADGALSWQGGGGGGGIYIEPPFYPATITSLDYFIADNTNNENFTANILDDDGLNNSPGTVLFTNSVAGSASGSFHNVPVSPNVVVTSGGIYVSWEMGGATIQLGTNVAIPISNRTYEILGGTWSIYRFREIEDLMIRANIQGSNTVGTNNISEKVFSVSQNYPNPSAASTLINFTLPSSGEVQFTVRNMIGQDMDVINFGSKVSGAHTIKVNTNKFAPGIYFYSLKFGDKEITKKMVVSR